MKNIYIFNITSRSIRYGIGTYIQHLIRCAQHAGFMVHYILISDEIKELEIIKKKSIWQFKVPLNHYGNTMNALTKTEQSLTYLLKEYITDNKNNIFHFNITRQDALISRIKKQFNGKFVITLHYTDWSFELLGDKKELKRILHTSPQKMNAKENFIYKSFIRDQQVLNEYADHIIAIAKHSYMDITKMYNVPPDKVTLINNALPDKYKHLSEQERNELRTQYKISPTENIIIFAGRLDEVKGIAILIRAFRILLERHPNSRLIIAGEGDYQILFPLAFKDWSKVTFTGYIKQKTLYELYSIADIGVVPSLHEEFGYVAIEMMMHRLPVIVNATTGLAEIIDHEKNGLHVMLKRGKQNLLKSAKELSSALVRLSESPQLRIHLGKNARKKYLSHYAIRLFNQRMKSLYQTL